MSTLAGMQTISPQTNRTGGFTDLDAVKKNLEDKKLKEMCSEFESVLFNCMLKSMRNTVEKTGLFYGGQAEDVYTGMLDQEYAKIMSSNTKGSLAQALYKQISPQKNEANTNSKLIGDVII